MVRSLGWQALMWLCADLVLGGDMGWSSSEPLVPEPSPSPIAPSCVTRHRARSKLLDQDTDRSDASRRVNSLIFTLGAPAGDRSRPPGGPGAHQCGGKAPPRRPLRPGVTRLSCRRACLGLRLGPPIMGAGFWNSHAARGLVSKWLPRATCASVSRAGLRCNPRRSPRPAMRCEAHAARTSS